MVELLRGGVEGGRDGDGDLLVVEGGALGGEAVVPGAAQVVQDQRGGVHRGDFCLARQVRGPPRQERRQPIGGVVAEPGFGGVDDAAGGFPGFGAGEAADDPLRGFGVAAEQLGGDGVFGEIEEGGEGWGFGQAGQAVPLRDREDFGPGLAGERREGERGVGGAEVDTDGKAGAGHPGDSLGLRESGTLGAGSQCGGPGGERVRRCAKRCARLGRWPMPAACPAPAL